MGPLIPTIEGLLFRLLQTTVHFRSDNPLDTDSPDEDVRRGVEDNQAFLKELTEANQRQPNGRLTRQEKNKLILMMKDYQTPVQ